MKKLSGLIPVLITPLNSDKSVDATRLKRLTEHLCSQDIAGLWVLGTGSEDMALAYDDRLAVARTVCSSDTQEKAIILGAGFSSHAESLNFMSDTKGLDFDAYHVMPYNPVISHDLIESAYVDLADNASKPVWLYFSGNWSQTLPHSHIKNLSIHENICGVKYSSSNIVNIQKAALLDSDDFQVVTAVVRTLYSCLQLGIKAATTVEACAYHKPIIEIFAKFAEGQADLAYGIQTKLNAFLEGFPAGPGKDNFLKVAESKYVLSKWDLAQEFMAAPYRILTAKEKLQIDEHINKNKDWVF